MAIWRQVPGAIATAILRMILGGTGAAMRMASPFVVGEAIEKTTRPGTCVEDCRVIPEGTCAVIGVVIVRA